MTILLLLAGPLGFLVLSIIAVSKKFRNKWVNIGLLITLVATLVMVLRVYRSVNTMRREMEMMESIDKPTAQTAQINTTYTVNRLTG
jgi:hypothetical protein